jgi:hypothetical protein
MVNFQISIERPEEIIPRLGKQELHWKKGRSAYELATSWMAAKSFPASVKGVLSHADEWREAVLLEAIFERETELGSRGRPSQTDLLAVVSLPIGNAILGIEGKVDEPFGSKVRDWLGDGENTNRHDRLNRLCETLGVDPAVTGDLFYQLFHRTCATIYEARRFRYEQGLMLVHSFSETGAWFDEFAAFSNAVGMGVARPGMVSSPKLCGDVKMRLGWVSDKPSE